LVADEDYRDHVPGSKQCAKYVSNRRTIEHPPQNLRRLPIEEFRAKLALRARQPDAPPWKVFVDMDAVNLDGTTVIPFSATMFLDLTERYHSRFKRMKTYQIQWKT